MTDYDRVVQDLEKIDDLSAGLFTVGDLDSIARIRKEHEAYPPSFDYDRLAERLEAILKRVQPE